jgi:hypothetical protein
LTQSISPFDQAAAHRAKAAELDGAERDYHLWLAQEWDKTATRYPSDERRRHAPRPQADQRRPAS